jgi:chemotaxis methyl-accepting protein methylase
MRMRAWSCGAAFGQEAYSLAMLLCEFLGGNMPDFDVRILATDIDRVAIEKARWASYDKDAMSGVGMSLLFKYFTRLGDSYVVSDRARALVTFRCHDVVSDKPGRGMDLVLCRNLLIYLERDLQATALENVYTSMRPGGYLVLGATENIGPNMSQRFEVIDRKARIYRKRRET